MMFLSEVVVVADDSAAPVAHRYALEPPVVSLGRLSVPATVGRVYGDERFAGTQCPLEPIDRDAGERLRPDGAQRVSQVGAYEVVDPERALCRRARMQA